MLRAAQAVCWVGFDEAMDSDYVSHMCAIYKKKLDQIFDEHRYSYKSDRQARGVII